MSKVAEWLERGYIRRAIVKDNDTDEVAKERGMQIGPPNLENLDWSEIKKDLHNELMTRELYNWRDVQASQDGVSAAVRKIITRRVIELYKLEEKLYGE